ncbi:transposase, partial [Secundilactobacillus oryzae]|uniref:transposase n=1 Tax=Secundilactobacillus oryzae TaxID=1202668 RepID=UPI000AD2DDCC
MQNNYNMNQLTLSLTTEYIPEKDHVAHYINQLVEDLREANPYTFGRPREYDLASLFKLLLFAYCRGVFSSRRIEQLSKESLPARWLTQESEPSYRTICRFRISDELERLINKGLDKLVDFLRAQNLLDDVTFIDGTKLLADANKYSFVWKKNTIRFDEMNRDAILKLVDELTEAQIAHHVPEGT